MRCREARSLLSARLDGELGLDEGLALDGHLAGCPRCLGEYRSLSSTVDLLRSFPTPPPDPAFIGRVFDRVRAHEAETRTRLDRRGTTGVATWIAQLWRPLEQFRLPLPVSLAAAGALGVLAGLLLFGAPGGPLTRTGHDLADDPTRGGETDRGVSLAQGALPSTVERDTAVAGAPSSPESQRRDSEVGDPVEVLTPEWWISSSPESPVRTAGSGNAQARIVL